MKNNELKNDKVEVPTGISMNDCDYLNSVLTIEKNMSNNYSVALNEASNDYIYEDYFTMFEDTKDAARDLYNLMFKYGWYILEESDDNKVKQSIKKLETQLKELDM